MRSLLNRMSDQRFLRKPSILVIVFSACFIFWFVDFWRPYNAAKNHNQFVWDVLNYYSYLPATFCNDGSYQFFNGGDSIFMPYAPDGDPMPKTTYGMSLLYSPFFAIGYGFAVIQDNALTGFSEPFATGIHWGSIIYVLLGIVFLRKFLLYYFNEVVTAITLVAVLYGSLLFMYGFAHAEMPHGYLFTIYSALLLATHHWHLRPTYIKTILVGLLVGIAVLIRPTEIYCVLFFVFWNVRTWRELGTKARFFLSHWRHMVLFAVVCFLYWVPQMIFWYNRTGSPIYFSYPGEGFFWNDPQIINILFSYRKGWITYTPLVIMAFVGFFFVRREFPVSKWLLFGVTALLIYVLSCWWDWFFGGSFGARAFCQFIAFLAIPIASLFDHLLYSEKKFVMRGAVTLLSFVYLFSCVCQNIGHTYHFLHNRIHFDSMTKAVYWDVFRTYQFSDYFDYWHRLDPPDYDKMRSGEDRDL